MNTIYKEEGRYVTLCSVCGKASKGYSLVSNNYYNEDYIQYLVYKNVAVKVCESEICFNFACIRGGVFR